MIFAIMQNFDLQNGHCFQLNCTNVSLKDGIATYLKVSISLKHVSLGDMQVIVNQPPILFYGLAVIYIPNKSLR